MAFKHISFLWSEKGVIMGHMALLLGQKPISPGHVGDMAFLLGQKTHITPFGALGSLAFDSTYDMK